MNTGSGGIQLDKKADRRISRTCRQLKEALMSLALEKGYDAITVEDITERADLGRTTFYLHYKDKEELLLETIDAIADELIAEIDKSPFNIMDLKSDLSAESLSNRFPVYIVFKHAQENADLYRIILGGGSALSVSRRIHSIIAHAVIKHVQPYVDAGLLNPKVPVEVIANYYAGTIFAMLTWWLENNPTYTIEEIVMLVRQLMLFGGYKALGYPESD
jgi:AcrR family transcriptional regulator